MPKLKKISPLDRTIDFLEQHIKKCELELQDLYAQRPVEKKKGNSPRYVKIKNTEGREFKLGVG